MPTNPSVKLDTATRLETSFLFMYFPLVINGLCHYLIQL
jgi:hypothetical protein